MRLSTRKLLDRAFSGFGITSIALMALSLVVLLAPIFVRGIGAFLFQATVEHRELMVEKMHHGNRRAVAEEVAQVEEARAPVYDLLRAFEDEIDGSLNAFLVTFSEMAKRDDAFGRRVARRLRRVDEDTSFAETLDAVQGIYRQVKDRPEAADYAEAIAAMDKQLPQYADLAEEYVEVKQGVRNLLGPLPGEPHPVLLRNQYGKTRWDRTEIALHELLFKETWDYSDPTNPGIKKYIPREEIFAGTALAPMFSYVDENIRELMRPRFTFYWQFFTDKAHDAHIFGGIWPEILGTIYLAVGAMIFAVPMGVIAAIYLCEYAKEGPIISLLRTCISTLAGVPSIVFGLFGLAFFINGIHVSPSKSVLAGSLTLALLILPTIIRASEEAIRAVPPTYKEAALSVGAGRWHTILTVILPAALPGILTGIVISMGRAAGETAPIIFTAAVSVGQPLKLTETLSQPTPALPWNIYNLATEHEAVDEIRHVQYGMVLTLVALVLLLNVTAIVMRARISKKLKG